MKPTLSVPIIGKVLLILAILAVAVSAGIYRIKAIQEKWLGSYTELPREVPAN